MKFVLSIFIVVIFSATAFSQDIFIDQKKTSGEFIQETYWMHGNSARRFMKAIQPQIANTISSRYFHSSKKISIDGIKGEVKLKIKEGIYGKRSYGDCCETYFAAFSSDRYRKERTSQMTATEEYGVSISIKRKNKNGFSCFEEQKALVRYIESLI